MSQRHGCKARNGSFPKTSRPRTKWAAKKVSKVIRDGASLPSEFDQETRAKNNFEHKLKQLLRNHF